MNAASNTPKLTEGPIAPHLIRLAIPASMGMVFNTLYNLTDFWFAGLLSDAALAGMSIAGSVFFLLLSIGIGVQTGASAVIAPEIGSDEDRDISPWINNLLGVSLFLSLLVTIAGWFVAEPLVIFLGAEVDIAPLSMQYLTVTLLGSVAFVLSFAAAGALMAFGDTKSNRNALIAGFFANFILNPLLTFGLDLGVAGLALATVLIKLATATYLLYVLAKRLSTKLHVNFYPGKWIALLQQIVPASFNMLTMILGGFITVSLIGRFGSQHVAGYAVGLRIEQVLLLPALGLNSAVMALAGQNFGANKIDRVKEAYSKGLLIGLFMAMISIPIMLFLSPALMDIFTASPVIRSTGATYLRIDAFAFYAYVVLYLSVAILQSIKQPLFPMILGIARQLVVPAFLNYVFIVIWGWPMVSLFYTVVSVVIVSGIISYWYTQRQLTLLASQQIKT